MKAILEQDGTLIIKAESGLESYALNNWMQELHLHGDSKSKIQVDLQSYDSPEPPEE